METTYFQDLFIKFSADELAERLKVFPFHIATILDPDNIDLCLSMKKGKESFYSYLKQSVSVKQIQLTEVLIHCGISLSISNAIGKVKRHLFVPEEYSSLAYLNSWIPFGYYSAITTPGLIGIMIQHLDPKPNQTILEIGMGSGYHAACISEVTQNTTKIYGKEINHDFYELGRKNLNALDYKNIIIEEGDGVSGIDGRTKFDAIYIPAAFRELAKELYIQLSSHGVIQGARVLSRDEFFNDQKLNYTREKFITYDDYLRGEWRRSVCVSTWNKTGIDLIETSRIYGVQFVPLYQNTSDQYLPYPKTSPFSTSLIRFSGGD